MSKRRTVRLYSPFAFLQQAKLLRAHGGAFKALTDLENTVTPLLNTPEIDLTEEAFVKDRNLAKVSQDFD